MNELSSRRGFLRATVGAGVAAGLWAGPGGATRRDSATYQQRAVASDSDWPMFQHDAWNSGTLDTTGPSEPVEAAWSFETDGNLVAQPIVKDGTVFQASKDSRVYAISADTGAEEWSVGTNRSLVQTPAVANSMVYVPTQTGRILAVGVGSGTGQWVNSNSPDSLTDVTLTDDGVLVADSGGNHVYSFDTATGDQQWRYAAVDDDSYSFKTPIVADGRIHVYHHRVRHTQTRAIDQMHVETRSQSDRTELWNVRVGNVEERNESNAVSYSDYDGGTMFVCRGDGAVLSLDAATGERNWSFSNLGYTNTLPVLADDTLYVTTEEPALYAIDPSIGTEQWRVDLNGDPTSPVVADGMVYLGCADNSVYGFDAQSSEQRWRFETGNSVVVPPVVLDGTVYAASTDGTLYALREEGSISPGDVTGDGAPAQDLDEDGLYEDVNGDGAFTIVDVEALFSNLDSDIVQENVSKFDFNGDGKVDMTDVQALYARLNE